MEKSKIIIYSAIHALGVLAYIFAVVYILQNVETLFSGLPDMFAAVPMLLLLVFSVALMGVLVFGRPVYLFMNGSKRQAIEFLIYTLGWIFIILILVFGLIALMPADSYISVDSVPYTR